MDREILEGCRFWNIGTWKMIKITGIFLCGIRRGHTDFSSYSEMVIIFSLIVKKDNNARKNIKKIITHGNKNK